MNKKNPKNLRKLAMGKQCMVRMPGICNGNDETTILAHYRLSGLCGTGMKPPDIIGAWCCSDCHDAVDGRRKTPYDYEHLRLWFAEGVFRTQSELIKMGAL